MQQMQRAWAVIEGAKPQKPEGLIAVAGRIGVDAGQLDMVQTGLEITDQVAGALLNTKQSAPAPPYSASQPAQPVSVSLP